MRPLIVEKGKDNTVAISLGFNVSPYTFSSPIHTTSSDASPIIVTWAVSFAVDGKDGELIATLDASATLGIIETVGYMFLKRTNFTPVEIFPEPVEVSFV